MWVEIFDNQRDQVLACKQNRNSARSVSDKICLGIKNGYFYGLLYNETLMFEAEAQEGWNFVTLMLSTDASGSY